jgi:alpha(1,3/1,4) fucosyltransferase
MLRTIGFYLQRTLKFFKESYLFVFILLTDYWKQKGNNNIRVGYNGHSGGPKKDWLYFFISELTGRRPVVSWYKPSLIICSSFGSYWLLKIILGIYKVPSIFFTEENLTTLKKYREYKTYLNGQPSLAMGFDYCGTGNYRRFPLWLMYLFSPEVAVKASVADIQTRLDEIEAKTKCSKTKFAAMVASHDGYASKKKVFGPVEIVSRAEITERVGTIDFVHCPGKLLHNDNSLKDEFQDDKKRYLEQFLFNICAENACVKGYVTEKIFEALEAGTIPIYWGDPNPEPAILNPRRIIFWDGSRAETVLSTIKALYLDTQVREQFLQEPLFVETAAQEIYDHFSVLKMDLERLLEKKI